MAVPAVAAMRALRTAVVAAGGMPAVAADIREAGIAKKRAAIVKDVSCELM